MNIPNKKGFTLVELLVVIAIIGILASIVVISLSGEGAKANDAKIKASLSQLATASVIHKNDNANGYTTLFTNNDNVDRVIAGAIEAATDGTNNNVEFEADNDEWVVVAQLPSDSTGATIWCIDYTGFKGEVSAPTLTAFSTTLGNGNIKCVTTP